jgi:hypothetical protein
MEGETVLIQQTCLTISDLEVRAEAEKEARTARRNRIRALDRLIDEFEMLNLADEVEVPGELRLRAIRVMLSAAHPLARRPATEIAIADWMDALYDLQDTLMLPCEEDLD